MKLSIIVSVTLVYCSVCVLAQEFKGPLEDVLKEKLNLSGKQFQKKCQKKSKTVTEILRKDRDNASKIGNALANDILYRVTISADADEHTWNRVVTNRCSTNAAVQVLTKLSVDEVNLCLDENEQLKGMKKNDFANALFKGYCAAVKKLAKEKYNAAQME